MSLPSIQHPIFTIVIPSTGETKRFRLYTVGEEKILLIAAENSTDNIVDTLAALNHVIKNCAIDPIDIDKLTTFDIEYIFVKLREHSVSDNLVLSYKNPDGGKDIEIQVPLKNVKIDVEERQRVIVLDEQQKISVTLGFPDSASLIWSANLPEMSADDSFTAPVTANDFKVIYSVIKQVTHGDEVFDVRQATSNEIEEFVSSLSVPQLKQITDWIERLPYVYVDVPLPNGKTERLRNIRRFFG